MDKVPVAFKAADINLWKCAVKGAQLHSVKPIMAYWCYYWVVNQILARQLHTADETVMAYTKHLMDALEKIKTDNADEEAITDDVAGQAYVEKFSQDMLERAERVMETNSVSLQTATTLDAAATFFQLVNIWNPADQETQKKIKYAKWFAARIVKASMEGRDPNESNPKQDTVPDEEQPSGPSRAVKVEEVPDVDAPGTAFPKNPSQFQLPNVPDRLQPPTQSSYVDAADSLPSPLSPPATHSPQQPSVANLAHSPVFDTRGEPTITPSPLPPTFTAPPSSHTAAVAPAFDFMRSAMTISTPNATASELSPTRPSMAPAGIDEAAMAQAQKYARWAISALNFEDVPTAVLELRRALEALGAS